MFLEIYDKFEKPSLSAGFFGKYTHQILMPR